ncbi:MAG TPA: hypothetical protein VFB29_02725 [Pseudolabrys sp.]|nr:hypothetical protein [Pseudolabrys sp.]
MPRVLIAFVIGGVLASLLVSYGTTVANTQTATPTYHNVAIVSGLHVALPTNMKNFPPERVPLP